jgi:putative addiction module component (TIGR02574 family)
MFTAVTSANNQASASNNEGEKYIMSKKLEEIINVAKELSLEERAELAGTLLLSLDEPSESELERLWLQEAERRLQDFREGKVKGMPAEEVFNRAIADIS